MKKTGRISSFSLALVVLAAGFSSGVARSDDCSFGDCYLVREANRERNEFLKGFQGRDLERERQEEEGVKLRKDWEAKEALKAREARIAGEKKEGEAAALEAQSAAAAERKTASRVSTKKPVKVRGAGDKVEKKAT